jgi:hypothetical protein
MLSELEIKCYCGHLLKFPYESVKTAKFERYDCHNCKMTFILRPFGDQNGERISSSGISIG